MCCGVALWLGTKLVPSYQTTKTLVFVESAASFVPILKVENSSLHTFSCFFILCVVRYRHLHENDVREVPL
jgi:hypothetical protein